MLIADRPMLSANSLSADALASVLEQSVDCVKLVGLDGTIRWMNPNGLCAMEIDDVRAIEGQQWVSLWPDESRAAVGASMPAAFSGDVVRFDAFCPTAKGSPRWWNVTVSAVSDLAGEPSGYLAISRDVTDTVVGREALEVAAAELRHRLKNTYAMIGSLIVGFARGTPDREIFAQEMMSRLVALSAAQALFATQEAPCEIETLVPALVTPFETPACRIDIGPLPSLRVAQGQADAIALVLGELAVNSAKHGALAGGGSLALRASATPTALELIWQESAFTPVAAHTRDGGQGLKLIERIVRTRGGTLTIEWHATGLTVTSRFILA